MRFKTSSSSPGSSPPPSATRQNISIQSRQVSIDSFSWRLFLVVTLVVPSILLISLSFALAVSSSSYPIWVDVGILAAGSAVGHPAGVLQSGGEAPAATQF